MKVALIQVTVTHWVGSSSDSCTTPILVTANPKVSDEVFARLTEAFRGVRDVCVELVLIPCVREDGLD